MRSDVGYNMRGCMNGRRTQWHRLWSQRNEIKKVIGSNMEIAEITQRADMKARVFFMGQTRSGDEGETGDDQ